MYEARLLHVCVLYKCNFHVSVQLQYHNYTYLVCFLQTAMCSVYLARFLHFLESCHALINHLFYLARFLHFIVSHLHIACFCLARFLHFYLYLATSQEILQESEIILQANFVRFLHNLQDKCKYLARKWSYPLHLQDSCKISAGIGCKAVQG